MLIAAGGLLTWAHTFIGNEVHTQLAADHFIANHLKAIGGHGDDDPFRQRDPAQVRRKL